MPVRQATMTIIQVPVHQVPIMPTATGSVSRLHQHTAHHTHHADTVLAVAPSHRYGQVTVPVRQVPITPDRTSQVAVPQISPSYVLLQYSPVAVMVELVPQERIIHEQSGNLVSDFQWFFGFRETRSLL
jgi:hypothetical protein